MSRDSGSYIDAMYGILSHQGWIRGSKPMLSGLSAFGFRFAVERRLSVESVTAYNWMAEHFVAADLVGIASSQQAGFNFDATFPLYRERAVEEIKSSIDRGIGSIFWAGEFVVAVGYDDRNGLLYYSDGRTDDRLKLPYSEFGCGAASPYWYYQLLGGVVELDESQTIEESLLQAVSKWETHELMLPADRFACGRRAYEAMIEALRAGDYDRDGAPRVICFYAKAKKDIAAYTERLSGVWKTGDNQMKEIAEAYAEVSGLFGEMTEAERSAERLIVLLRKARDAEERAVRGIRSLLQEKIDNRFHDIGLR